MNRWFLADTHFGHANIITFKDNEGNPLRDFKNIEEHDETIIERWNEVVRDEDKVYCLGDMVINRRNLPILGRLKGKKKLVRGNHDIFRVREYLEYFDEIYAYRVFNEEGFICSHIPLHPECMDRWKANVHGHLHSNRIGIGGEKTTPYGEKYREADPRYICVSCEQTGYRPLEMEEIKKKICNS